MFQQVTRHDWGGKGAHRDDAVELMWGYCGVFLRSGLQRVNLDFNHLQPFGSVAFPILTTEKNALKGSRWSRGGRFEFLSRKSRLVGGGFVCFGFTCLAVSTATSLQSWVRQV